PSAAVARSSAALPPLSAAGAAPLASPVGCPVGPCASCACPAAAASPAVTRAPPAGLAATLGLGGDDLPGELTVVARAGGRRVQDRDGGTGHGRLRELHRLGDHRLVHLVAEG